MRNVMKIVTASIFALCALVSFGDVAVMASRAYVNARTTLHPVTNNGEVVGYNVGIQTNIVLATTKALDFTTNNTILVGTITNVVNDTVDAAITTGLTQTVIATIGTNTVSVVVNDELNNLLGDNWRTTYGGGLAGLIAAILAGLAILKKTIPNNDTSLSVSGAYADAKTVGEKLALRATVADLGNGVFRISDNVVDTTSTKVLY